MEPFKVTTTRLSIRPLAAGDRPAVEQMTGDAEMMRYITGGRVFQDNEVDAFFARQARYLEEHGFCVGALTRNTDGAVVGVAGLQPLDTPGEIELAWWVWKEHWGQGYATEAACALVEHGFGALGLRRLVAVIDPANASSIRVAEKAGLRFERRMSARETVARRDDVEIDYFSIGSNAAQSSSP